MPHRHLRLFFLMGLLGVPPVCLAQFLPSTPGETLNGRPIVVADAVRGQAVVLIAGFSREGGNSVGAWAKALRADPAFQKIPVYQIAMIAGAPRFVRGMIKSGMKKGVAPADQDRFVVLTEDEQAWKSFFGVTADSEAYVVLLDPLGKTLWHGHGPPAQFEPQLKMALH